jgi:hypothetical protein
VRPTGFLTLFLEGVLVQITENICPSKIFCRDPPLVFSLNLLIFFVFNPNFFAGGSQKKDAPASAPTPAISAGVTPENTVTRKNIPRQRACPPPTDC